MSNKKKENKKTKRLNAVIKDINKSKNDPMAHAKNLKSHIGDKHS